MPEAQTVHTRRKERFVLWVGALLFGFVAMANEWTVARFLTADGAISQPATTVVRLFDLAVLLAASGVLYFRSRVARQLTVKNVVLTAMGIVIGWGVVEIGSYVTLRYLLGIKPARTGVMSESNLYIFTKGTHPALPFSVIANFEQVYKQNEFNTVIRTNNVGMREATDYHGEHVDVACIGDSFTFGLGVDYGERYCDYLRNFVVDRRVLSYGYAGFTTPHYYLFLKNHPELIPDTLILGLYPHNDFDLDIRDTILRLDEAGELRSAKLAIRYLQEDGTFSARQAYETLRMFTMRRAVTSYSYTGKLLYAAWSSFVDRRNRQGIGTEKMTKSHAGDGEWMRWVRIAQAMTQEGGEQLRDAVPFDATRDMLSAHERIGLKYVEAIHRLVNKRGSRLIVFLIPMKTELHESGAHPNWKYYKEWLAEKRIEFIDPYAAFAEHDAKRSTVYYGGDEHWQPFGHRLAADLIIEYLKTHPTSVQSSQ